MTTKRTRHDPLATAAQARWLVLHDMFRNLLDSTELPAHTDLRKAFAEAIATLEIQGWQSEGASGAMVFVRRGNDRRLLSITEADPQEPSQGHFVIAGRCATCE